MGIRIHPEAAKRLDELANRLLARVAPAPQSMAVTEHFRPDIYPVAHINEQDILGELQVTESIIDGTGAEVGRVFEHENRRWALIGQDFKSFLRVTLQDSSARRNPVPGHTLGKVRSHTAQESTESHAYVTSV